MVRFIDGPAIKAILTLGRAPKYLRVVLGKDIKKGEAWDALDQLTDTPKDDEALYAYELIGEAGVCFIDGRNNSGKRVGTCCVTGDYQYIPRQPSDEIMRDTKKWRDWCRKANTGLVDVPE